MDNSRLTRQVISSQGCINKEDRENGKRAGPGQQMTTKKTYHDSLKRCSLFSSNDIDNQDWLKKLTNPNIASIIESNLGLAPGAFKKLKCRDGDHFI